MSKLAELYDIDTHKINIRTQGEGLMQQQTKY